MIRISRCTAGRGLPALRDSAVAALDRISKYREHSPAEAEEVLGGVIFDLGVVPFGTLIGMGKVSLLRSMTKECSPNQAIPTMLENDSVCTYDCVCTTAGSDEALLRE